MPPGTHDEYRISARIALVSGARYVVRFIDELCLPLIYRGQYKQLPFVVDTAAKITVVPAHFLQQGNLLRKQSGSPSTFESWYRFPVPRGHSLADLWFPCRCLVSAQQLPRVQLAFGDIFTHFSPSFDSNPFAILLRLRRPGHGGLT